MSPHVIHLERDQRFSTVVTQGCKPYMELALKYMVDAYADEPLVCIRGRDLLAIPAITAYAGLTAGLDLDGPVTDGVLRDIAMFQRWQGAHPERLKYPDRPRPGTIKPA